MPLDLSSITTVTETFAAETLADLADAPVGTLSSIRTVTETLDDLERTKASVGDISPFNVALQVNDAVKRPRERRP